MEFIVIIFFALVAYCILYFVVKAAVRDGIVEARQIKDDGGESNSSVDIQQTVCPECGERHDIDYPKCPNCGHEY